MSKEERKELDALTVWLKTFPAIENVDFDKENANEIGSDGMQGQGING